MLIMSICNRRQVLPDEQLIVYEYKYELASFEIGSSVV